MGRLARNLPQGYSFHITLRCNSRQFLIAKGLRRDVLLAVLTKAKQKVPHRLYVIPYGERPQVIPILPYLLLPPPPLLEQTKPRRRGRDSGRDQDWEDDFDWLMEND